MELTMIEPGIGPEQDQARPNPGIDPRMGAIALPKPAVHCTVLEWLQTAARRLETADLFGELNRRLVESGLSLHRSALVLRTLHPQYVAGAYMWHAATGKVEVRSAGHEMLSDARYLASPVRHIFDGAPGIRRRIMDADCPNDFSILDDLREQGVTDYVALPLPFSDGRAYAASWATAHPEGFTVEQLDRLNSLMPTLAMALEVRSVRDISRTLMNTYVGPQAGARVLNGAIQRGSTETIDAVIWYSDLRGFTRMAESLSSDVMLAFLNDHFEHVGVPIKEHGGEILKFMGDGLLAIFPLKELGGPAAATSAALRASADAWQRTGEANDIRRGAGAPVIAYDMALHLGEVVYGNIGAPDRLDFTVIGPAVNQAARMEGYCRTLDRPLLMSAAFAGAAEKPLTSLGFHALRGVPEAHELFSTSG